MRKQLGQMLIEAGAIDEAKLRTALTDQLRWGRPLGRTLVDLRLIKEEELIRVLGQQLGLPSVDLDRVSIPKAVTDLVAVALATQHGIIPFSQAGKFLDVAMSDPTNLGIIDELRIRTQLNIRPYLAGPKMIERSIYKHYGGMPPPGSNPNLGERLGPSRSKSASTAPESIALDPLDPSTAPVIDTELMQRRIRRPEVEATVDIDLRNKEIDVLQERVSRLEALVSRDEDVLRKLLSLLIDKGIATREEILARLG
jgi:type IV pilus assembly protein PilB